MKQWLNLRASEWVLFGFFTYTAIISPFFPARAGLGEKPVFIAFGILLIFITLSRLSYTQISRAVSFARDWLPIALTLAAFREMELFVPRLYDVHFETAWIAWDRLVLDQWHVRAGIESLGFLLPGYLEFCYLVVYAVPVFGVAVLYLTHHRPQVSRFLVLYLLGTVVAYGLFPYFPSQPPRFAFPSVGAPTITTPLRSLNLSLLNAATIHTGVFPSAHVSSAFSAAWGLLLILGRRRIYGWGMLFYAISVSIATVYGRYHYVADVLAGLAISLFPAAVALLYRAFPLPARADIASNGGDANANEAELPSYGG